MTVASIICYEKLCLLIGSNTKYFARSGSVVVVVAPLYIRLAFFVLETNMLEKEVVK